MTEPDIAACVAAAARAAEIELTAAQRPGTLENFARLAAMAALVNGLELDAAIVDPAPVFRHD
jgi:hypothetical protein